MKYIKFAKVFNLDIKPESVLAKEIYSEEEILTNIYIKYGGKAAQYAKDIRFKEVNRLNKASAQYINLLYPLLLTRIKILLVYLDCR